MVVQQSPSQRYAISRQRQQGEDAPSKTPGTLQVPALSRIMCRLQLVLAALQGAPAAAEPLSGTPAVKGQPKQASERLTAFNGLGLTALNIGPAISDVALEGQGRSELRTPPTVTGILGTARLILPAQTPMTIWWSHPTPGRAPLQLCRGQRAAPPGSLC